MKAITRAAPSPAQPPVAIVSVLMQYPKVNTTPYPVCYMFHTCAAGVYSVAMIAKTSAKKDTYAQEFANNNVVKFVPTGPAGSRVLHHATPVSTNVLGSVNTPNALQLAAW